MDFLLQIFNFVLEVFCLFVFFFLDKFTLFMGWVRELLFQLVDAASNVDYVKNIEYW